MSFCRSKFSQFSLSVAIYVFACYLLNNISSSIWAKSPFQCSTLFTRSFFVYLSIIFRIYMCVCRMQIDPAFGTYITFCTFWCAGESRQMSNRSVIKLIYHTLFPCFNGHWLPYILLELFYIVLLRSFHLYYCFSINFFLFYYFEQVWKCEKNNLIHNNAYPFFIISFWDPNIFFFCSMLKKFSDGYLAKCPKW